MPSLRSILSARLGVTPFAWASWRGRLGPAQVARVGEQATGAPAIVPQ
jgi:hypothetical protein